MNVGKPYLVNATILLRTAKIRGCLVRQTIPCIVYKLGQSAQKRWQMLRGLKLLDEVIRDVRFKDGGSSYSLTDCELKRAVV